MTKRVYLHVGAPKSGTTYLQQVLEVNRIALYDAGVLVVGESHLDRVHAAMVVRKDPRLEALPERARTAWARLVKQIRNWRGDTAILSYELFAGASAEQVQLALADLDGLQVHVVVTARDLAAAVPSAWQERLKFALTTPLEEWKPRPESAGVRAEWGWRTMDPAGVAARWGASLARERIHIVTVPKDGTDRTELWRRFAAACDVDVDGLRLDVDRVNQSLGVAAAELLRRVNEKVGAPITGSREQSRWLRDTLAHKILAPLGSEPIGLTDEHFDEARRRAEEAVARIVASGYDVCGDLGDLRATRSSHRLPGDTTDTELLEVAVQAIVGLLELVRERTLAGEVREGEGAAEASGLSAFGKGVVRRVTARHVDRRHETLRARIAELEEEAAAARSLHLRVAELTDVVTELLLPPAQANRAVTGRALTKYRKVSL